MLLLLVVTQQSKSNQIPRSEMRGVTYREEVQLVRNNLSETGFLTAAELNVLTHSDRMEGLKEWATSEQVPLVDVIAAVDDRRDTLVSWVQFLRGSGTGSWRTRSPVRS